MRMRYWLGLPSTILFTAAAAGAEGQGATVRVEVRHEGQPVAAAAVVVNGTAHETDVAGVLTATVPAGAVEIVVVKQGFASVTSSLTVAAGQQQTVEVDLQSSTFEEEITVSATRTDKRLEDQAMRVEVLAREEIEEKMLMTPGDIVMMLNETGGLRVQATSPSLGAASVRIQGMQGRYTRFLSDGLPLFGEVGGLGPLQIPPMDLGQVEVIKGVASSLYGAGAMGGVVNLISRRPGPEGQREFLVNRSMRGATDAVGFYAAPISSQWGVTTLSHWTLGALMPALSPRHCSARAPSRRASRSQNSDTSIDSAKSSSAIATTRHLAKSPLRRTAGCQTWVAGAAIEMDGYRPRDLRQFEYTYTIPGIFAQDDVELTQWLSLSASARVDHHSEYGTFFSPRIAALLRSGHWNSRVSIGTGFFGPSPLTEETEAAGLSRLVIPRALRAEEGRSASFDLTRTDGPLSYTVTLFSSRIQNPLDVTRTAVFELTNATEPTTNAGAELLGTLRREPFAVTATYTYVRSRESDDGAKRDAALKPRHSAGIVGF